jgi:serine/threonine-protein kinase HipA
MIKNLQVTTPQGASGSLQKESRFVFNYQTTDQKCEVSLLMPLRAESYSDGRLFSVFEMNRPEGYLLDYLRERFGKHERLDDMRLLSLTGGNQIGRLRYSENGAFAPKQSTVTREEIIGSMATDELFSHLIDIYFGSGISGFQPKVMVPDSTSQVTEKSMIATSDLIVKSAGEDYPFLAQNEFMCMEVARRAGMSVPEFWLSKDGNLFVMKRFDIRDGLQMGLEDMVVVMAKTAEEKYHGSYEGIAKVIDLYCGNHAVESKERLFQYIALSCLVKNGDAHLKNFSLMYDFPGGDVSLSPLYDVVTTTVYEITNPKTGATKTDNTMALNMRKSKSYPLQDDLIEFGRSSCLVRHAAEIIERIQEMKYETYRDMKDRIDPWLAERIVREWGLEAPGKKSKRT